MTRPTALGLLGLATNRVSLTDGTTVAIDTTGTSRIFDLTLGASGHTISNPTAGSYDGQEIIIRVRQPSSGGPYTFSWGTKYRFPGGTAPVAAVTASASDLYRFARHLTDDKWDLVAFNSTDVRVVPGQILARTDYNPASFAAPSLAANQITTWVTFDSTNLRVTFTAPLSGKVRVRLISPLASNASGVFWRVATTAPVGVTESEAFIAHDTAGAVYKRYAHEFVVTGLTAGTSYTWIWQGRNTSTTNTANLLYGTSGTDRYGPAVMEIAAA